MLGCYLARGAQRPGERGGCGDRGVDRSQGPRSRGVLRQVLPPLDQLTGDGDVVVLGGEVEGGGPSQPGRLMRVGSGLQRRQPSHSAAAHPRAALVWGLYAVLPALADNCSALAGHRSGDMTSVGGGAHLEQQLDHIDPAAGGGAVEGRPLVGRAGVVHVDALGQLVPDHPQVPALAGVSQPAGRGRHGGAAALRKVASSRLIRSWAGCAAARRLPSRNPAVTAG